MALGEIPNAARSDPDFAYTEQNEVTKIILNLQYSVHSIEKNLIIQFLKYRQNILQYER